MNKKIMIGVICIILICLAVMLIRENIIQKENFLEKTKAFSREEIIELLDKGADYNNYYRKVETENGTQEYYYKDNILVSYINGEMDYWMNLNDDERKMIVIEDSENKIAGIVEDFENIIFPTEYTQVGYYITVYDEDNFKYQYLGKINFNNRETLVVNTIGSNGLEIKYYIDEETGVVVKRKETEKWLCFTKTYAEYDRGITFDIVTDENIQEPNLEEYTVEPIPVSSISIY